MKATILDVAKMANVSKATVSRVLNNKANVSEEIKERVFKAIEALDFRPSAIARSLVNKRTKMIGLVLPDITNPFFTYLARGVEDAAHRHGYTVFLCNSDNESDVESWYIEKLKDQQVDGIILISSSSDEEKFQVLRNSRIPWVLCDRINPQAPVDAVTVDNYEGAVSVVEYLIGKGHKKILHLAGPALAQSAEHRREGYLAKMKESGLTPSVHYGSFTYESGYQVMKNLLREEKPTAVFAANDLMAIGAIKAIEELGLKVPDDIAIIGCDDIFLAELYKPALTTLAQPAYQMGVKSMDLLHERIEGLAGPPKHVILNQRLIIRQSCGGEA